MAAKRTPRDAIDDILEAIRHCEAMVRDRTFAEFAADPMLGRAVEREFEIISEASRQLPSALREPHAQIPWHEIRAIGNVLRHEYYRVDPGALYNAIRRDFAELRAAILAMAAALGPDD